jgi:hypothetical protein
MQLDEALGEGLPFNARDGGYIRPGTRQSST